MDEIVDLLDSAAKRYPMKALAPKVGKAESTLRNELTQQPGYKLSLTTAIMIMQTTGDTAAIDRIEALLGRVAHALPPPRSGSFAALCRLSGDLAVEFGEQTQAFGQAMRDGRITRDEAEKWLKELWEANRKGLELQASLERFIEVEK